MFIEEVVERFAMHVIFNAWLTSLDSWIAEIT